VKIAPARLLKIDEDHRFDGTKILSFFSMTCRLYIWLKRHPRCIRSTFVDFCTALFVPRYNKRIRDEPLAAAVGLTTPTSTFLFREERSRVVKSLQYITLVDI